MTSSPLALPAGRIIAGRHAVKAHVLSARGMGRHLALTEPNQETLLEVFGCEGGRAPDAALAVLEDTRVRLGDVPSRLVVAHLEHGVDGGLVWAAAPWPASPPLAELASVCALTPVEAVELAHALAASVDAAHGVGMLHLALDASCVHVAPFAKGAVAVAGFGMARACEAAGGRPWSEADAPELVARGAAAATPASDVHGAAGVLLQAVTGAKDVRDAERRAEEVLPSAMVEVLARARSADPQARYASVGQLAEAFADALEGKRPASSRTMPVPASSPAPVMPPPMPAPPVMAAPVALPEPPPSVRALSTSPFAVSSDALASEPHAEAEAEVALGDVLATKRRRTGLVVAASIVGVLGAAAAAVFVVTHASSSRKTTTVVAAASAAPASSSSAPVAVAEAPPEPSPALSAAPAAPAAPLGPKEAELSVVCTPACETVLVNGKPLASYPEPVRLAAGTYGIGVSRAGHGGQWKKVVLRPGARETLAFTLTPAAAPAPAARKKDCGKFLKRCD